jgi:hypothetical protein
MNGLNAIRSNCVGNNVFMNNFHQQSYFSCNIRFILFYLLFILNTNGLLCCKIKKNCYRINRFLYIKTMEEEDNIHNYEHMLILQFDHFYKILLIYA